MLVSCSPASPARASILGCQVAFRDLGTFYHQGSSWSLEVLYTHKEKMENGYLLPNLFRQEMPPIASIHNLLVLSGCRVSGICSSWLGTTWEHETLLYNLPSLSFSPWSQFLLMTTFPSSLENRAIETFHYLPATTSARTHVPHSLLLTSAVKCYRLLPNCFCFQWRH
jgi:hypothetical protein